MNVEGLRPDDDMEAGLAANSLRTTLEFGEIPPSFTGYGDRERIIRDLGQMNRLSAMQELTKMYDAGMPYDDTVYVAEKLNLLQPR